MSDDRTATFRTSIDLRELRADLESLQLGLGRELPKALREAIEPVARQARGLAPYDPQHDARRRDGLGHIRDSIQVGPVNAKTATIVSTHPAAAVFEWADDSRPAIAPRGVPLTIKSVQMAHKAAEQQLPDIERRVITVVDGLIARYGL